MISINSVKSTVKIDGLINFEFELNILYWFQAFDSPEVPRSKATPEELVRVTKPITLATAKAVAAGNSCRQDDVIVAANVGRKAISDMLTTCKGAAYTADTNDTRLETLQAGRETALQYRELLVLVLHAVSRPNPAANLEMKNNFPVISRKIAHCVTSLVSMAEILKGKTNQIITSINELMN